MTDSSSDLTRRLADFASRTRFADLPSPVVRESKRLLLDTIGCALGAINTPSGRVARDYARVLGGTPTAGALGLSTKVSPTTAAYVNARLANVLDADDTFPTATHFGSSTVFAALALAEHFDRSGQELITAIAVGFDVGARIGSWMGMPVQVENGRVVGWNTVAGPAATVTWAGVGSAVSISGVDADAACHAFGIAGANSPLPAQHKFGEQTKIPMHKYADSGWCAQVGVSAALLASLGSTGFSGILDGENGFWRLYGQPGRNDKNLLRDLGSDWQILNTTYKPWPCCRFIHYPLTAFEKLRRAHDLRAEEIEKIVVRSCPFALGPMFHDRHPQDMLDAEFSYPHAFAAAAHDIPAGPQWYETEFMGSDVARSFRERVEVELEPTSANMAEWIKGGQWRGIPGGVDVYARGRVFQETSQLAMGDPWSEETLLSEDDLISKFKSMVGLGPQSGANSATVRDAAANVIRAIEELETIQTAALTAPLAALAEAIKVKID